MIYLVHVAEGIYEGTCGVEHIEIITAQDYQEAAEIAEELSLELMESYSNVINELEQYIKEEIDFNDTIRWTEERIERLRSDIYYDNIRYDLYELNEDKIKEYLEKEANENLEEFLSIYGR